MKTLDMQLIRYINLFEKISGIRTKNCFLYNNIIIFVVPRNLVSKAIGEDGKNVRQLSEILGKRAKIVSMPYGIEEVRDFVNAIINPLKYQSLDVNDNEIVIRAGRMSKAALIGRNKARLEEMKEILKEYFGKDLRIV